MGARARKPSSLFDPGYDRVVQSLIALRDAVPLTQQQLADRLKRHRSFVWKTEGGQRRIDLVEFVHWCRACEADPAKVFASLIPTIKHTR
jgi:transcriptional regulator with XRE-family HTH domain